MEMVFGRFKGLSDLDTKYIKNGKTLLLSKRDYTYDNIRSK